MPKIYPDKLHAGDEIRVISPSSSLLRTGTFEAKLVAKDRLEALGFKVTFGDHILDNDVLESASIASRLADFHAAFSDKNVKAVLCTIGGFDSNELLPYIDWSLVRDNPKIFCGYSDITALHAAITAQTGLVTYYGPAYTSFLMDNFQNLQDYQTDAWLTALTESSYPLTASSCYTSDAWYDPSRPRQPHPTAWRVYHDGRATGTIIGGNLNTFCLVTGTPYQPVAPRAIAFLENAEEDIYDWDRELAHFLQIYPDIAGLVIGRFPVEAGMTDEILRYILDKQPRLQEIPVIYDVDFGHTQPIFTFPIGGEGVLQTAPLSLVVSQG